MFAVYIGCGRLQEKSFMKKSMARVPLYSSPRVISECTVLVPDPAHCKGSGEGWGWDRGGMAEVGEW